LVILGDFGTEDIRKQGFDARMKHFERKFRKRVGLRSIEINAGHFIKERKKGI
jgi:hypothetical protein